MGFKVVGQDGSTIFEKVGGGQGNVNACFDHALNALLIQQSADSVWISSDAKNQEELLDILSKADGPVVLSFMANWCGPCKAIAPYIAQQSEAKGVHVVKVDVDEAGDLAMKYGISAMPTFKVVRQDGSTIFEKVWRSRKCQRLLRSCPGRSTDPAIGRFSLDLFRCEKPRRAFGYSIQRGWPRGAQFHGQLVWTLQGHCTIHC